jgi:hypothetical protein
LLPECGCVAIKCEGVRSCLRSAGQDLSSIEEAATGAAAVAKEAVGLAQEAALGPLVGQLVVLLDAMGAVLKRVKYARAQIDAELEVLKTWSGAAGSDVEDHDAEAAGVFVRSVREAARDLPPRQGNVGKTTGLVLDMTGRRAPGAPIVSGRDPSLIEDLVLSARERLVDPLKSHVEAYVARALRQGDLPREVVLVLNNTPCFGPNGCHQWLPRILPAGTRVHVYVVDGRPLRLHQTYDGHGRRIRGAEQ